MFVDEVDIHVAAGGGGRGCLAFRREKFVPRGGASGGGGGPGGAGFFVGGAGRGCLASRREKFVPRGGPSGGDGGHGGSVFIVASPHTNTLINFRFHPEFTAERGQHGMGSHRTGDGGQDLELAVPIGTLVYETTGDRERPYHLLADLADQGQRVLVARGGRGG